MNKSIEESTIADEKEIVKQIIQEKNTALRYGLFLVTLYTVSLSEHSSQTQKKINRLINKIAFLLTDNYKQHQILLNALQNGLKLISSETAKPLMASCLTSLIFSYSRSNLLSYQQTIQKFRSQLNDLLNNTERLNLENNFFLEHQLMSRKSYSDFLWKETLIHQTDELELLEPFWQATFSQALKLHALKHPRNIVFASVKYSALLAVTFALLKNAGVLDYFEQSSFSIVDNYGRLKINFNQALLALFSMITLCLVLLLVIHCFKGDTSYIRFRDSIMHSTSTYYFNNCIERLFEIKVTDSYVEDMAKVSNSPEKLRRTSALYLGERSPRPVMSSIRETSSALLHQLYSNNLFDRLNIKKRKKNIAVLGSQNFFKSQNPEKILKKESALFSKFRWQLFDHEIELIFEHRTKNTFKDARLNQLSEVRYVETKDQKKLFYFIPPTILAQQVQDPVLLNKFLKLTNPNEETFRNLTDGVKRIFTLDIGKNKIQLDLTRELIISRSPARLLCAEFVDEKNNAILIIPFIFISQGLHTNANLQKTAFGKITFIPSDFDCLQVNDKIELK